MFLKSVLLSAVLVAPAVLAELTQTGTAPLPLASYTYTWPNVPEQVNPFNVGRGPQIGYNICNSSTYGPNSLCQTAFINNLADFCLWAPSTPDSTIADTEAAEVAWCTTNTHGTRQIPAGAIQGVQFMRTPGYVQVVGFINQALINIQADDSGGELDDAGADGLGNPIGGIVFSNSLPSNTGGNDSFIQAASWSNFMGSDVFCFKACDPSVPNSINTLCQHTYDLLGCDYNAPADYDAINGTYTSCEGENQLPVGVYVTNGVTSTWDQPPESIGVSTVPYNPSIPPSSNCVTFSSEALFGTLSMPAATVTAASTTSTTSAPSSSPTATAGPSATHSTTSATHTTSSSAGYKTTVNGAAYAGAFALAVAFYASL